MVQPLRHHRRFCWALLPLLVGACAGCTRDPVDHPATSPSEPGARQDRIEEPRRFTSGNLTIWWDRVPETVRASSGQVATSSNIRPTDYAGPESCRRCHKKKFADWSAHPHRWMNALAGEESVRGDFSGTAVLHYLGGKATFFRAGTGFRMRLARDTTVREYAIHQTIGSRFFQYYVGSQLEGPEPDTHKFYKEDHVLPFGYWIDGDAWTPVVHVGDERPDDKRQDPFDRPPTRSPHYSVYSYGCNYCHTTFPLGDMMIRQPYLIGQHAPVALHLWTPEYLRHSRDELWNGDRDPTWFSDDQLQQLSKTMQKYGASNHAVTLGISCEACHLGSREHAADPKILPRFFPVAPELVVDDATQPPDHGRSHRNVNWACGRCHTGKRPEFAGGISTWNSIEYTDGQKGSCYSRLRCIDCHEPHTATGPGWTRTPTQDDQLCLQCHQQYDPAAARAAHTHHPTGSSGSRCMNCHMPRITEGLQHVVRTHTIHSPTKPEPIEANHLNACNLCHTDRSIRWTLEHLDSWYGKTYSQAEIRKNYPRDQAATGTQWLDSSHESVRLVAFDALARTRANWALPRMFNALDDPFLLNRQFAARALEQWLGLSLADAGYRFFMTPEERRPVIARLKRLLLPDP